MRFAAYPAPFIHATPGGKRIQQLIWGDYLQRKNETDGEWVRVVGRGENGWMRKTDVQEQRLLEINFVDIGQGDGSFIVTPEDRRILIDAGEQDNMHRFLSWRFNLRRPNARPLEFESAVISHPDLDHYLGFRSIFANPLLTFRSVYHNGIVERAGGPNLGPTEKRDGRTLPSRAGEHAGGAERIAGGGRSGGEKAVPQPAQGRSPGRAGG